MDIASKVQSRTITVRRSCANDNLCSSCSERVDDVCICEPRVASSSSPGRATEILYDSSLKNHLLILATSADGSTVECTIDDPQPYDVYKFNYLWQCSKSEDSDCAHRRNCSSCLESNGCNWCGEWGICFPKESQDYNRCKTVASTPNHCCIASSVCSNCLQMGCGWCNYHECLPGSAMGPSIGFNDSVHGAPRCHVWKYSNDQSECNVIPPETTNPVYVDPQTSIKRIAQVAQGKYQIWNGTEWINHFITGVDIGIALPGLWPGDLMQLSQNDYFEWFAMSEELGVDAIRVYTLLPPTFYKSLYDWNNGKKKPLLLFQGIWSPEEELVGEDQKGRDAWNSEYLEIFIHNCEEVVGALHGDIIIDEKKGQAFGVYTFDVAAYVAGYIIGTEWWPLSVNVTNNAHSFPPNWFISVYNPQYLYFRPHENANSFEVWVTYIVDLVAQLETSRGWSSPLSISNWPSTDPIPHPLVTYFERNDEHDCQAVDPLHIVPTGVYKGGYFGSFHIYPYWPGYMHGEYNKCPSCRGTLDGYSGYLKDLKDYLDPLPTIVSEFGVPSSIASSHSGPGGRAQGGHSEVEMGMIIKDMLHIIYEEGYAGAFLFILYDEWYKKAWNTEWLQDPNMRPYWLNPLTSEQFYGVVGILPGVDKETSIWIDGLNNDWKARDEVVPIFQQQALAMNTYMTHDEGYVYIMLENNAGSWSFPNETIFIGFDVNNQGGVLKTNQSGDIEFWGLSGIESVLKLNEIYGSHLYQNPFFDPLYYQYGDLFKRPTNQECFSSYILMMQLAVNLSSCGHYKPMEYYDAGYFYFGNQTQFSMSYWFARGNILEIRIPWMLLGFTFPGTRQIHNYFTGPNGVDDFNYKITTDGLKLQIFNVRSDGTVIGYNPISYSWNQWGATVDWYYYKKSSFDWFKTAVAEVSGKIPGSFSCAFERKPFCQANATTCNLISFDSEWLPELKQYYNLTRFSRTSKLVNFTFPEDFPTYSNIAGIVNSSLSISSPSANSFNINSPQCSVNSFTHLVIHLSISKNTTFTIQLTDCLPSPTTSQVYKLLNSSKLNTDIYISLSKFGNIQRGIASFQITFSMDVVVSLQRVFLVRPENISKISTGSFTTGAFTTGKITSGFITSSADIPYFIQSSSSKEDHFIPLIAGVTAGGFVLVVSIIVSIAVFFIRRRRFTINKVIGSLKKRQVRTDPTSNRTQPSNSTPLATNRITSFYPNIPAELTQTPTVKILPPVKGNQKPKGILGAILANDIPLLKNVLEKVGKQELNARDSEGWTPLHVAAKLGQADIVHILLQAGAKTRIKSNEGTDAFDVANQNSYFTVAKIIADHQQNSSIKTKEEIESLTKICIRIFRNFDHLGIGRVDKQSLQKCIKEILREIDLPEDAISWEEIESLCEKSSVSESNFASWLESFLHKNFLHPTNEQQKEGDSMDDFLPDTIDL